VTDRLLRAEDVAERLQLTTDRIYSLCRSRAIPHVRLGRTVRFRSEAIDRWLEEQEQLSAPGKPAATAATTKEVT
jgi:excisionase family DNA binding protein